MLLVLLYSHFWYLNFVRVVLATEVVPRSRSRRRLAANGRGRALALRRMQTDALHTVDGHRYRAVVGGIEKRGGLAQLRVVERLLRRWDGGNI